MKIKINRSLERQLRPVLDQIANHDIWYPIYNLQGEPVFRGRDKYHEFYNDLDQYVDFKGKTVIDLGCNLGHYSFLAARLGATRVVGLDINTKMIEACNMLRDYLMLPQVDFKVTDFFFATPSNRYDIVLLIDYIGKNVINKFKLKQVLTIAERYSRKEIFLTFHHAYSINDKLRSTEENLIPFYTADLIRDGKFQVIDYVKDHFAGKGMIKVFEQEERDWCGRKPAVHFLKTEFDQA